MWQLKSDKIRDLERAFRKREIYGAAHMARATNIPLPTLQRMMKGNRFSSEANLRSLFDPLLISGGEPSLDMLITEYCDEVPGPKRGREEEEQASIPFDPPLLCLLMYFKFLHLRDQRLASPVYQKFVPRLKRSVDVFDEFILIKTLCFKETQRHQEFYGRSMGVVDIQPIFPPRRQVVVNDLGLLGIEGVARHIENEPSQTYQTISFYENGLQHGNEEIGGVIPDDCARAVVMADFTSLPVWSESLLPAVPSAYHLRPEAHGTAEKSMGCWQTSTGVWVMDSTQPGDPTNGTDHWQPDRDTLQKDDKIEMRFSIAWHVVNNAP